MLKKRIIPCLDIKNGRTVKGVNFVNIRDAGDPVELGELYAQQGADELVFLDITATNEGRKTFIELVRSEEHTSELQSPVPISYAVFRLKKKTTNRHSQQVANIILSSVYALLAHASVTI